MSDVATTMKIVQLESEISAQHRRVSALINLIEQIEVALEEDDAEEALRLIKEQRGD